MQSQVGISNANLSGWPSVFYFFGAIGVAWFPIWVIFAHESPEKHPYITQEEVNLIRFGNPSNPLIEDNKMYSSIGDSLITDQSIKVYSIDNNNETKTKTEIVYNSVNIEYNINPIINTENHIPVEKYDMKSTATVSTGLINDRQHILKSIYYMPWKEIFTNKVSLTSFVNNWVYVSILYQHSHSMASYPMMLS